MGILTQSPVSASSSAKIWQSLPVHGHIKPRYKQSGHQLYRQVARHLAPHHKETLGPSPWWRVPYLDKIPEILPVQIYQINAVWESLRACRVASADAMIPIPGRNRRIPDGCAGSKDLTGMSYSKVGRRRGSAWGSPPAAASCWLHATKVQLKHVQDDYAKGYLQAVLPFPSRHASSREDESNETVLPSKTDLMTRNLLILQPDEPKMLHEK
ncbi:hypothetical protein B0H66DRAFT_585823 [Apodospora peruviana]|uniref:Uncharacterized protein n=1 Tax=Apodospora peruviana TaxID=516989 RepID=A0AAE0IQ45_9PEZI|nr:hypothetical protein B0H66DRAFT_585823 [Apodospora peruviana]